MALKHLLLVAALAMAVGRAEVVLSGIVQTGSQRLFALADTSSGASRWAPLAASFSGYELTHFDEGSGELTLSGHGTHLKLRLQPGRVSPLAVDDRIQDAELIRIAHQLSGDQAIKQVLGRYLEVIKVAEDRSKALSHARAELARSPDNSSHAAKVRELEDTVGLNAAQAWLRSELVKRVQAKLQSQNAESNLPRPNKSLQPTATAVMPPAAQEIE
jgi:hypothetical protein